MIDYSNAMKRILGCGALNLDYIFLVDDLSAFSKFGLYAGREVVGNRQTAKELISLLNVRAIKSVCSGGGSAANTLAILSRLGMSCLFTGVVGGDREGKLILDSMKGVDCSFVSRHGLSPICIVVLDVLTRDRALYVVGPEDFIMPDTLNIDSGSFDILHLTSLVNEQGLDFQMDMVQQFARNHVICFDPGEVYASKGMDNIKQLISNTDILFITSHELELLTGKDHTSSIGWLIDCMKDQNRHNMSISQYNVSFPAVVYKQGADGATLYSKDGSIKVPAVSVDQVEDNTGAGDAFAAGFLYAMSHGADPFISMRSGAVLASYSLKAFGRGWLEDSTEIARGLDELILEEGKR